MYKEFVAQDQQNGTIETPVQENFLARIQRKYPNISIEEYHTDDEKTRIYRIQAENDKTDFLPKGYCLIGGTARSILQRRLGKNPEPPRDMDICLIDTLSPIPANRETANKIAATYMPHDLSHGYGVSRNRDITEYMNSRDFTINQVLVSGRDIYVTEQGLQDTLTNTVRLSEFRNGVEISKKLIFKALLLKIRLAKEYGSATIEGLPAGCFRLAAMSYFNIALSLNKAYQMGNDVAHQFYSELVDNDVIGDDDQIYDITATSPRELAYTLRQKMIEKEETPFEFSRADLNNDFIEAQDDLLANIEEQYFTRHGKNRGTQRVRNISLRTY